ncbi:MotA/TolQ/ExbB proton channel family protein [Hylemonella gracilis]|uniref:Biopolymer transport protein ExbB n=1 Tax=Hylemonella gracilis ATCC 19624 TaxID=887062 RepID=F3KQV6_9BURK|nr:MotA/TolQ/ExbB proton channel family protein [Hylemonella gracilis]EGI77876.1 MotA/TolQ/ExbB proton channel [Hylemonella gracilis ATCC 19624]
MDSQFGLSHVWSQGDWITRSVALLLLGMSIASWVVIVLKALDLMRCRKQAALTEDFWRSTDLAEGLNRLNLPKDRHPQDNFFRALAEEGREAALHHRNAKAQLHDSLDVSDWVTRSLRNSIDNATAKLQGGLAVLATVGSTSPFIGLFGTVWGIYHALLSIGASGQASIDQVAGPIGEALIMTAFGLAVAIPAVLGNNALVRGNKAVLGQLNSFAHDLHAYFVTGARVHSHAKQKVVSMKKA